MVAAGGQAAPVYAAAVCAGAAAWLCVGQDRGLRRARLLLAGAAVREPVPVPPGERLLARVRERVGREWWCLAVGLAVAVVGESVLPLVVGALGVPLLKRVLRGRDRRRQRLARADAVIVLCAALAAEVRAGRQPGEAMLAAVRSAEGEAESGLGGSAGAVLAAARFGGDVPQALRAASAEPGAEGLLGLAACWRVAVDRGGGLAAGLARLEGALRAERDQRADLRVRLSTARSTAALLAALPVVGLLMGLGLGADPLRVLLHTPVGLGCLLVGGCLEGAGIWWAVRIVRRAEGR
ncbi:type II secretion system F family protein [Streptomyces cavernicola]|uniref:Type II secretion system F family protein n=1 Tax=Streptomyces cavernicola TaxID=3043613 RepID=A0ABT6SMJ2_9ACTN|nr:type II secretion system F family protein [Streptomyces sp. B-S-A6]MDI3409411.1 type II secretion system F family protein [Streptomyces sp. B-S-A6]